MGGTTQFFKAAMTKTNISAGGRAMVEEPHGVLSSKTDGARG